MQMKGCYNHIICDTFQALVQQIIEKLNTGKMAIVLMLLNKNKGLRLLQIAVWDCDQFPEELRQRITDRLSLYFLCVYCDNPNPLSLSAMEYRIEAGQKYFTAFAICANCNNKFSVKIQDYGKVK